MGVITAHSGCDGTQENSLEFLKYAMASGADCLEVDVRRDRVGNLFLSHDGAAGDEVKLQEAFSLLKGLPDKKINCDLKLKDLEISVYQLAREFKVERQLIYSGEVSLQLLAEKEKRFPEVLIYLNVENLLPEVYCKAVGKEILMLARNYPIACINMEYHLFTDEIVDVLAQINMGGSAWTVDEPEDLRRLMEKGIANITTRNLKKALEFKEEMRG